MHADRITNTFPRASGSLNRLIVSKINKRLQSKTCKTESVKKCEEYYKSEIDKTWRICSLRLGRDGRMDGESTPTLFNEMRFMFSVTSDDPRYVLKLSYSVIMRSGESFFKNHGCRNIFVKFHGLAGSMCTPLQFLGRFDLHNFFQ